LDADQISATLVLVTASTLRSVGAVGAAGVIVTLAGAIFDGSAFETAMTVTVLVDGKVAGAE